MKKIALLSMVLCVFALSACSKKPKNNFVSKECTIVCNNGKCKQKCTTIKGTIDF